MNLAKRPTPAQIRIGTDHELEHTTDRKIAKKIAMDHLREDPRYYIRLKAAGLGYVAPTTSTPTKIAIGGIVLIGIGYLMKNKIVSALRTPEKILAAVAEVDPENTPDLQPGWWPEPPGFMAGVTWCNKFIARVTEKLGCPIPFGKWGTRANDQIAWLDAANDGWYPAIDAADAQAAALAGKVAVATWHNLNGPGHMALVLPIEGPIQIAQAGATNFNQGNLARGFGSKRVVFYIHD